MRLADVAAHWRQQAELTSSAVERNAFRHCADELEAAAPVTDAGLDVERLARALPIDPRYRRETAERIAAEYAALSRQAEKETA
jgi:hypothetical protein